MVVGAGVMALVSAYMLFKLRDLDGETKGFNLASSLQALFFFLIIANFILIGSAGYESRNDCSYLLQNATVNMGTTINSYEYVCTDRIPNGAIWIYKLPVWLAYFASGYVVIYLISLVLGLFTKGGRRG